MPGLPGYAKRLIQMTFPLQLSDVGHQRPNWAGKWPIRSVRLDLRLVLRLMPRLR